METIEDILHALIDVVTGRRNLPSHEADKMHEAITPGYTATAPSDEDIARAEAIFAARAAAEAKAAERAASA